MRTPADGSDDNPETKQLVHLKDFRPRHVLSGDEGEIFPTTKGGAAGGANA